jgi:hypothetical protein
MELQDDIALQEWENLLDGFEAVVHDNVLGPIGILRILHNSLDQTV